MSIYFKALNLVFVILLNAISEMQKSKFRKSILVMCPLPRWRPQYRFPLIFFFLGNQSILLAELRVRLFSARHHPINFSSGFLAKSWHITSHGMFAGSCIGVIQFVMSLESRSPPHF